LVFAGSIQGQRLSKASGQKKEATSDAEDGGKVCFFIFKYIYN
jgi:hypothetical protein